LLPTAMVWVIIKSLDTARDGQREAWGLENSILTVMDV